MKKKLIIYSLIALSLVSCGEEIKTETVTINPSESGGMGANQDEDVDVVNDDADLMTLLTNISTIEKYSYELNVDLTSYGSETVTDYYTKNAYFEKASTIEDSFGYAQNANKQMFRYYLSGTFENPTFEPSIFEYDATADDAKPLTDLYSALSLTNFTMLKDYLDVESAGNYVSLNRYLITDDTIFSIFQFMSTYGSSLSDYLLSIYVNILDLDSSKFTVEYDLGDTGTITATYTPLDETLIDFVSDGIDSGDESFDGVYYYDDIDNLFTKQFAKKSYVLQGIYGQYSNNLEYCNYKINCTNDYFLIDYYDNMSTNNGISYQAYFDYGFMFLPYNSEVTVETINTNYGAYDSSTGSLDLNRYSETSVSKLAYDACYEYEIGLDGKIHFTNIIGPLSVSGEKEYKFYESKDDFPEVGESYMTYITVENGAKVAYTYSTSENSYELSTTRWFDSVDQFFLDASAAGYYLTSSGFDQFGKYYIEKDLSSDDTYYSKDSSIYSFISSSLFGWGFQSTTTWTDYIQKMFIDIVEKDANGDVTKANIGLDVLATQGTAHIYYQFSDFGNGNVALVDEAYAAFDNGGNN